MSEDAIVAIVAMVVVGVFWTWVLNGSASTGGPEFIVADHGWLYAADDTRLWRFAIPW